MGMINRCALLLRPRQPFLDWINAGEMADKTVYTLTEIQEDPQVYLIPECFYVKEAWDWVYKEFDFFFEEELEGWNIDDKTWPKDRTLEMFKAWFDIEILTGVTDAVDEPIEED